MCQMWSDLCSIIGMWVACAIAAERTAEIIADSKLFAPFRNAIGRIALPSIPYDHKAAKIGGGVVLWFFSLITCGWCTSVWTSAFFSLFLPGSHWSIVSGELWPIETYIVKIFCLVGLANFWHAVFRIVHRGRQRVIDIRHEIVINNGVEKEVIEGGEDGFAT